MSLIITLGQFIALGLDTLGAFVLSYWPYLLMAYSILLIIRSTMTLTQERRLLRRRIGYLSRS